MTQPLAYRIRPNQQENIIGQDHLFNQGGVLANMLETKQLFSMIFFGPPGVGKTTTAIFLANQMNRPYRLFNAVTGNKKELDAIYLEAKMAQGLVLIMDEVHRLNKDRQDTLLPYLEEGLITLIGATTANPLFAINPAIRSRCHLIEFKPLSDDAIINILTNALRQFDHIKVEEGVLKQIANNSNGDSRYALNVLELALLNVQNNYLSLETLNKIAPHINMSFDKDGDYYYETLSGLQKSIRGSDVNAALYYLAKLIEANDFISLERRLLTTAYEDIGLANPQLVARVLPAIESAKRVGFPEARIMLSNVVIELALSPKSKSAYHAINDAIQLVQSHPYQTPEYLKLNNHLPKQKQYDYARSDLWHQIQYLPDAIKDVEFYQPNANNSYEKLLSDNYQKLKQYPRTNNLEKLNQSNKK